MIIAVVVAVYNEEKYISEMIDALLNQTKMPDQIVIVDDGSKDNTANIIKEYARKYSIIKYIYQQNKGPAVARNNAWRNADADICIFTDGDCIPEANWIEKLIVPFSDNTVAACAGTYKTVNKESILARFIGLEIDWKYQNVRGQVDCHGTYNLAVRKNVLEEIGGLNEEYPVPSGEDWDMTYKISEKYKIIFVPEAIVGHYHPEKFGWYMKNQRRRAFDRMKVYKDHPNKKNGDTYTGSIIKYQILASGLFIPSVIFFYPFFKFSYFIPLAVLGFVFATCLLPFVFYWKRSKEIALYSILVQFFRNFAWFLGMVGGAIKFGYLNIGEQTYVAKNKGRNLGA